MCKLNKIRINTFIPGNDETAAETENGLEEDMERLGSAALGHRMFHAAVELLHVQTFLRIFQSGHIFSGNVPETVLIFTHYHSHAVVIEQEVSVFL